MKKFLALALALVLIVSLPIAASAATAIAQENMDIQVSISKAAVAPVIDGKLDADSYQKIDIKQADLNLNSTALDLETIAFDAYYSYDDNNVYILLSGDEKYHYCDHTPDATGDIWNQSCIQISVGANNTVAAGTERLEIGFARNNDGVSLSNMWADGSVDGHGSVEYSFEEGKTFKIANDGGRLNYEVVIPWNTFLQAKPAVGEKFGLNFMYVWSADDVDVREKLEFSSGCDTGGKNADMFAQVTLTDNVLQAAPEPEPEPAAAVEEVAAPVVEAAAAPVVEAPAPVAVPQTGDATMIMVLVLIAVAGVATRVVVKQRSK